MYMNNPVAYTGNCGTCFTANARNIISNLLRIQVFVSCGESEVMLADLFKSKVC